MKLTREMLDGMPSGEVVRVFDSSGQAVEYRKTFNIWNCLSIGKRHLWYTSDEIVRISDGDYQGLNDMDDFDDSEE